MVVVWFKLHVSPDESYLSRLAFKGDEDVEMLQGAIKEKFSKRLQHFDAAQIQVYPAGTPWPLDDTAALDVDDVTTGSSKDNPFIVTMSGPPAAAAAAPQNGKCFCILLFKCLLRIRK